MVTPDEIFESQSKTQRLDRIESYFDGCLTRGTFTDGQMTINQVRGGWSPDDTEAVLSKYRAFGWKITGRGPWVFSKA